MMELSAVEHAAVIKRNHYGVLAKVIGAKFHPFIIEHHGSMGYEAIDIINQLANESHNVNSSISAAEYRSRMYTIISVSLQKGNAFKFARALCALRSGAGDPEDKHEGDNEY